MRMKNISARLVSTTTAALFVFVLAGVAAAQGRYTDRYSRADVDTVIRNVEDRADEFRRDFYAELERSNMGSSQERVYRNQVNNFENATDRLRSNFDSDNQWWQSRNQVRNVITNATPLNSTMNSIAFRRRIERQWNQLRNAVNRLADTYDLPGVAGGGWQGGPGNPGNPGGGTSRPPNWAVGTWYWVQGSGRSFTIDSNGRVTENLDGEINYGTYNNGNIHLGGSRSSVTRTARGIRTYNFNTGETSDYTRRNTPGGEGGNTSRPPSWAVGTWRWVQGSGRRFTIQANGRVVEYINGRTNYGTYYNGILNINGTESDVRRTRDGIQTYNRLTGEVSDYRRQ